MAVKRRVFISHSGFERIDGEDQFFLDVRAALQADFDVLDDGGLSPGSDWRHELYAWMGLCDAAVIILSPSAKRPASKWVPRECMVLCWRKELSPDMPVIPVFYPDFAAADLQDERYREIGLERLNAEAVDAGDKARAIARILEKLANLKTGNTPLEVTAQKISDMLQSVPEIKITAALAELPNDLGFSYDDKRLMLGFKLAHFGFAPLENGKRQAVEALHIATRSLNPEQREKLVNLLAPSWIDLCRLHCFRRPVAAAASPVLVLNASDNETAKQHIRRAFIDRFTDPPATEELLGDGGEHTAEEVSKQVAEVYARNLPPGMRNRAASLLREVGNRHPVYFSVSQQAGVPISVLYQVQANFRQVAFIYLAGESPPAHLQCSLPESMFVEPRLKTGEEDKALNDYSYAYVNIGVTPK